MAARKTIWAPALLLAVIAASWGWGCQPRGDQEPQRSPLRLSLAIQAVAQSGLIAIAEDKGFFKESGLEVSVKNYPSGFAALEAMCRGEAQMATAADFAFSRKLKEEPSLRVVASIGLSASSKIVARKDRTIREPSDLKIRTVGFSQNTISEYFLDIFLLESSIARSEVRLVNIPSDRIVDSLVNGEVDAASLLGIHAYNAKKRLGENGMILETRNPLYYHWALITKESLIQSPEPIKRFLRAILRAEDFILAHEDEAKSIVTRRFGLDPEYLEAVWDRTKIKVGLSQSLVYSLDSVAQWTMAKGESSGEPPKVLDLIYTGALDEIDPKLVTIFR